MRPVLGREPLWFDSRKRPLNLGILSGRLREVQLYNTIVDEIRQNITVLSCGTVYFAVYG